MKVYVIRHGESESNRDLVWTGWCDVHLTEKGRAEAAHAGKMLENVGFDKIYTSDLLRARETAEAAIVGCEYECSALLREVNVGDLAGKPVSCVDSVMRQKFAADGYGSVGGESHADFSARVREFMKKLENSDCQKVAIFSHAGWLRTMLDEIMGVTLSRKHLLCSNCAIGIFDYSDGVWKMSGWINPSENDIDAF